MRSVFMSGFFTRGVSFNFSNHGDSSELPQLQKMHQTLGICEAHYCALDRQNSTLAYVFC